MATTPATVTDNAVTAVTDDHLAAAELTPARLYEDSGYLSAEILVNERRRHGITLAGPLLADTSAQARAGNGYALADFAADYARRADIEGTMNQAVRHGARRARYRGLAKTRLEHAFMAVALNFIRLHAYWTGTPLNRGHMTHLARLELDLAA
ncbi:MAG: transposase [Trebonia sp.]